MYACEPLCVRLLDAQGEPVANQAIQLNVKDKEDGWMLPNRLFSAITSDSGDAIFEWYPRRADTKNDLDFAGSPFFVRETTVEANRTIYRVAESAKTVVPGYTYHLFINDETWVSKPAAAILVERDSTIAKLPPTFEIVKGTEVTIAVTAGPESRYLPDQLVHLETPFDFKWVEKEGAIRKWKPTLVGNGNRNYLELHRELSEPTVVRGKLVLDNSATSEKTSQLALNDVKIAFTQADASFGEYQSETTTR